MYLDLNIIKRLWRFFARGGYILQKYKNLSAKDDSEKAVILSGEVVLDLVRLRQVPAKNRHNFSYNM